MITLRSATLSIFALALLLAASPAAALAQSRPSAPASKPGAGTRGKDPRAIREKSDPAALEAAAKEKAEREAALRRRPMVSKPTEDEVRAILAEGKKVAVVATEKGTIRFELQDEEAPLTVANFVKLARAGFYDGLTFHRVVKEPKPFVIQGGDPLGNGMGNPGYTIEGEFSKTRQHLEGTVAMARAADPNSAGCQFYICLAPAPHLDGQYAIFGQVVEGMDVVKTIVQGDVMTRVTIEAVRP